MSLLGVGSRKERNRREPRLAGQPPSPPRAKAAAPAVAEAATGVVPTTQRPRRFGVQPTPRGLAVLRAPLATGTGTAAHGEKPAYRSRAGATPTPKPSGPALSRYLAGGRGGAGPGGAGLEQSQPARPALPWPSPRAGWFHWRGNPEAASQNLRRGSWPASVQSCASLQAPSPPPPPPYEVHIVISVS